MIIFGIDMNKVNWYMIAYILASIVGLVYGTNKIYSMDQVRGVVFAIGALIVLVYFGLRWFGSKIPKSKNWPPVINMCPDYLTYVPDLSGSGPGCVDMLGVASSSSGIVTSLPSDISKLTVANTTKVFKYTSADIAKASTASDLQTICDYCKAMGVTWEGIYDGDSCVGISRNATAAAAKEACLISV